MADNVKFTVELVDKSVQKVLDSFINKSKQTEDALGNLEKKGKTTFDEIAVHIGKASGIYDIFVGNLAANLAVKSLEFVSESARELFNIFVVEGVAAAKAYETSLVNLNTALALSGKYSKETSKDFEEFASSVQKTTKYSDDSVLSAAALIQNLGNLSKDGLKEATQASLNLASALNLDLNSAATLVGKAAQGQISTFSRYGIVIDEGKNKTETFANTLRALSRLEGSAEAQSQSYEGRVTQLSHSFEDVQKNIGFLITKNGTLNAVLGEATSQFLNTAEGISDNRKEFESLVSNGIVATIDAVNGLVKAFDYLGRVGSASLNGLFVITDNITLGYARLLNLVGLAGKDTVNEIKKSAEESAKAVNDAFFGKSGLEKVSDALTDISAVAKDSFSKTKNSTSDYFQTLSDGSTVTDNVTLSQKELNKALEDYKKTLSEGNKLAQDKYDQDITQLNDYYAIKNATDDEQERTNYQAKTDRLVEQSIKEQELLKQKYDSEIQLAETAAKGTPELEAKKNEEVLRLQTEYNNKSQHLANQLSVKIIENGKRRRDIEEKERRENIASVGSTFGALADLAALGGRRSFDTWKAFASAEALISGYLAVQKALAEGGAFSGPVLAAAMAIKTAANVKRINDTKPPAFAEGGIVPGASFQGDNVLARVNSGEMILNQRQQADLFNMINKKPDTQAEYVIHNTITLDGDVLAKTISRKVADGFKLGVVT